MFAAVREALTPAELLTSYAGPQSLCRGHKLHKLHINYTVHFHTRSVRVHLLQRSFENTTLGVMSPSWYLQSTACNSRPLEVQGYPVFTDRLITTTGISSKSRSCPQKPTKRSVFQLQWQKCTFGSGSLSSQQLHLHGGCFHGFCKIQLCANRKEKTVV